MRKVKSGLLVFAVTALLLPALVESISAQGVKIGYVRDELIKQEYKAWVKAEEQWRAEAQAWEDEALSKQEELDELKAEFEKQKLILSDEKKREKEATIRTKEEALDAFTRQIYGPNGTAERKNADLLQPLLKGINKAIESVAIDGNYDVVFTLQSGLAYIKEDYDITDKVIKVLEENAE